VNKIRKVLIYNNDKISTKCMNMLVTCRYSFRRQVHFKKMHYVIILKGFLLNDFVCNVGCAMNRLLSVVFVDNFY
jgi:hypothetical protein